MRFPGGHTGRRPVGNRQPNLLSDDRREVLIFSVAPARLDWYEDLRRQFEDWRDVRILLDRREGDRRAPHGPMTGDVTESTFQGD